MFLPADRSMASRLESTQATTRPPPPNLTRVPVGPFRDHFLRLERCGAITRGEVARALGWFRRPSACNRRVGTQVSVDTGKVSRTLGLSTTQARRTVSYETGVALCEVLGIDPVDVGV